MRGKDPGGEREVKYVSENNVGDFITNDLLQHHDGGLRHSCERSSHRHTIMLESAGKKWKPSEISDHHDEAISLGGSICDECGAHKWSTCVFFST